MILTIAVYYQQKPYVEKEHQSTCCDFFSIEKNIIICLQISGLVDFTASCVFLRINTCVFSYFYPRKCRFIGAPRRG